MVPIQRTNSAYFEKSLWLILLISSFIFSRYTSKSRKEKIAPNQHQLMNAMEVEDARITFFTNTASMAVNIIAQMRNWISGFFNKAHEKRSSVVSKTK